MSATEDAVSALVATLAASPALPTARRDAVFDEVLEEFSASGQDYARALILRIGDSLSLARAIGDTPNAFEHVRNVDVEWLVAGAEGQALATQFDYGVDAIFAALEADRTLGGVVDAAEIAEAPEIGAEAAGAKAVLTALIRVQLTFTSPRAY